MRPMAAATRRRREWSRECARRWIGQVARHRGKVPVLTVRHQQAVVEGREACQRDCHDGVNPDARDGVEGSGIVQWVVHCSLLPAVVAEPVADNAAVHRAAPPAGGLTCQVHVHVRVHPCSLAVVVMVGEEVLIVAFGTLRFGEPQRYRERSIDAVVEASN